MSLFGILVYVALAPISLYLYILIGRILKLFKVPNRKKVRWIVFAAWIAVLGLIICTFAYIFLVAIIYFCGFNLIMEAINFVLRKKWTRKRKREASPTKSRKSRRAEPASHRPWNLIYRTGVVSVFLTMIIMTYGIINGSSIRETTYTVTSTKISDQGGYKIAFFSDLHLGGSMDSDEFKKVLDDIGNKNVDILILGGDIFDENTTREEMEKACEYIGDFKSTYGSYYIFGNHDERNYAKLMEDDTDSFSGETLREKLGECNITILEDEISIINNDIVLVGRKDKSDKDRLTVSQVMRQATPDDPEDDDYIDPEDPGSQGIDLIPANPYVIMIDHQPIQTEEKVAAGIDLVLSGHTHGGQIFPLGILNTTIFSNDYNYGYYEFDNTKLIISSGIGCWGYKIRTDHHCEYVIIDIKPEKT